MLPTSLKRRQTWLNIPLGSKLSICSVTKSGERKEAPLTLGPQSNHYFALFKDDDVDFEIKIENGSEDRTMGFDVEIQGKRNGLFLIGKNATVVLPALETKGRKLHFISQSCEKGQALVADAAVEHGVPKSEAKLLMSQMKCFTDYSKLNPKFTVTVRAKDFDDVNWNLTVRNTDTIGLLKDKLVTLIGVSRKQQKLEYEGMELVDWKTFEDYDMTDEMIVIPEILVNVKYWISVVSPTGKLLTFDLQPTDTITKLKSLIKVKTGIGPGEQRLSFDGTPLRDMMNLRRYNFKKEGAVIMLKYGKCLITVLRPDGQEMTFNVALSTTVGKLKTMIEGATGIESSDQRLKFNGWNLEDEKTLKSYGIVDDSQISLNHGNYAIFVERLISTSSTETDNAWDLKKMVLDVTSNMTIDKLKTMIEEKEGIPKADQNLKFKGQTLDVNGQTLKQCEIFDGAEVSLNHFNKSSGSTTYPLFIKTLTGRSFLIGVEDSDTIEKVKTKIEKKEGVAPDQQRLVFGGKQMSDENTLKTYSVRELSTIHLVLKLAGGGTDGVSNLLMDFAEEPLEIPVGERGAICFGEISDEVFLPGSFDPDYDINIVPFIIEVRTAGK